MSPICNRKIYHGLNKIFSDQFGFFIGPLFFVIAKIQRIGHDYQTPLSCYSSWISSGDTRRKQAAT